MKIPGKYYTETMAQVYADQGYFDRAFAIYKFLATQVDDNRYAKVIEKIEKKIVADNYQGQIGTIIKTKVPFNMELSEDLYGKVPFNMELSEDLYGNINPDIKDSNNNNNDDKNTDSKLSDLFEKWVRLLFIEKSFMELRKRL
ncbi:MAG: hypothetical protein B6I31_05735 [Desulfobacteraceae bacterium 4572_19]|nr:MAG: hypothetical protein B6I31_05735 [Desulfobacteraceae bacterium 4572_19]